MAYRCEYCQASFQSYYSLRSHKNGSSFEGIPRCARIVKCAIAGGDQDNYSDNSLDGTDAVIATPVDLQHDICRRHQNESTLGEPYPLENLGVSSVLSYTGSVNYGALVLAFRKYCRWLLKSRSQKFWSLYLATRHLPQNDQRNILEMVRKLFKVKQIGNKHWCADKRAVRYLMTTKPFWPLVTYTYTCDLTAFCVPGLGVVTYTFVDPIFAWIMQARKLCKKYELLFRYREARRKGSGERTWGSCVSCGEAMHQVDSPGRSPRYFFPGRSPR